MGPDTSQDLSVTPAVEQPSVPSPVVSENPYKRNWRKWLVIYGLIAVFIYCGIYIYANVYKKPTPQTTYAPKITPTATPLPDPTANWITYTDKLSDYSLKYPPSWTLVDNLSVQQWDIDHGRISSIQISLETPKIQSAVLGISVLKEGSYLVKSVNLPGATNFTVDGYPAYKFVDNKSAVCDESITIPAGKDGNTYTIDFSPCESTNKIAQQQFDQILSTFKFTDSSASATPTPQHCGGFIANSVQCPRGYDCKLDSKNPDVGGTCVPIEPLSK